MHSYICYNPASFSISFYNAIFFIMYSQIRWVYSVDRALHIAPSGVLEFGLWFMCALHDNFVVAVQDNWYSLYNWNFVSFRVYCNCEHCIIKLMSVIKYSNLGDSVNWWRARNATSEKKLPLRCERKSNPWYFRYCVNWNGT